MRELVPNEATLAMYFYMLAHNAYHVILLKIIGSQSKRAVDNQFCTVAYSQARGAVFFDPKKIVAFGYDERAVSNLPTIEYRYVTVGDSVSRPLKVHVVFASCRNQENAAKDKCEYCIHFN